MKYPVMYLGFAYQGVCELDAMRGDLNSPLSMAVKARLLESINSKIKDLPRSAAAIDIGSIALMSGAVSVRTFGTACHLSQN